MRDYLSYWGVSEPVFARRVPVESLYLPHHLTRKLERLKLAVEQRQPLVALVGDAGTGKSTALRWLYQALDTATHDVLLTSLVRRETGAGWLAPRLAEFLGVSAAGRAESDLIRATAARLDELIAEKRSLVVAVDAAHFASVPSALEEIAAFLNLTGLAGRCLSFVLAGLDPLLDTLAATPELESKLALHTALSPLTRDETKSYLEHRLTLAGVKAAFDDAAVDFLHLRTRGVMATVDVVAENALVEAFQKNVRRISPELAKAALPHGAAHAPEPSAGLRPFARTAVLAEDEGERPASMTRLASGAPPPTPDRAASLAAPESEDRTEGKAAKESSSIKLASLFKSDTAKTKP